MLRMMSHEQRRRALPRLVLSLAALLLLLNSPAAAQRRFGYGLVFGEPTGLSWKYTLERANAIDGVVGFSPENRFRIHADYLWISRPFNDGSFSLHYGAGAVLGFGRTRYLVSDDGYFIRSRELGFAARIPIGIDYAIPRSPCEVYFELAPMLIFAPDVGAGIDAGVGLRIYP